MDIKSNPEAFFGTLAGIGALVGIGQLLASDAPLSLRIAAGRALISAGLGAAAGVALAMFPSADPVFLYGLAAAGSSLGASGVERLMGRVITGKSES
jgi:hypothetical protein